MDACRKGWSLFFKLRFRMSCPGTPHLHLHIHFKPLSWFEMDVKMMFWNIIIKHSPPSYCKTQDASHREQRPGVPLWWGHIHPQSGFGWAGWWARSCPRHQLPLPPACTPSCLLLQLTTHSQFLQREQRGETVRRACIVDGAFIHDQHLKSDENLWETVRACVTSAQLGLTVRPSKGNVKNVLRY